MGFRITTNMMMNSYRYNLQGSTKKLSDARDMVLTHRYFNSYAEDPAAATLAFRLRRSWAQTSNYLSNTKDVYSKFNTAWNNLTGIVHDLSDATARVASIRGNNGPTGEARSALAIVLRETAESVVQSMNQKLGDHFIFAGNDALNAPFSWENGKLLYRGVDVLGGWVDRPTQDPAPSWVKLNPETGGLMPRPDGVVPQPGTGGDDWENAWIDYYWDQYYREMKAVPNPSSYRPEWADNAQLFDADGRPDAAAIEEWLEENTVNGMTSADEAWIEYYTRKSEADPEDESWVADELPKLTSQPDWFEDGNVPAQGKDAYEQAWVDYYNYYSKQQELPEEPVLNPSEYVPEWTKNEGFFEEDGKLKAGAVEDYLKSQTDPPGEVSNLDKVWIDYYDRLYEAQEDLRTLRKMSGEEMYIDLGMGAAESSPNNPVKGTYFNSALCGIDFLGFGVDEDGDPKNLALIMRELADVFDTWGENGQMYLPREYQNKSYEEIRAILDSKDPDVMAEAAQLKAYHAEHEEKAFRLMDKLKAAQEHLTAQWVDLDAQSVYLQSAETRLTTQATDLNIQFLDVEQVDMAEAITNFTWQYTCYNAALKIGTQLLSQTLIDYMS